MRLHIAFAALTAIAALAGGCDSAPNDRAMDLDPPRAQNAGQNVDGNDAASAYDRPGFTVKVIDNRLWVFEGDAFPEHLPDKHSTFVGAGPDGMTIKAPDAQTVQMYLEATAE